MSSVVELGDLPRFKSIDLPFTNDKDDDDGGVFEEFHVSFEEGKQSEDSTASSVVSGDLDGSGHDILLSTPATLTFLVDDDTILDMANFDLERGRPSNLGLNSASSSSSSLSLPMGSPSRAPMGPGSSAASVVKRLTGLELADDNLLNDSMSSTRERSSSLLSMGPPRDRSCSLLSASSVFSALRNRGISLDLFPEADGPLGTRPRGLSLEFSMLPTSMLEIGGPVGDLSEGGVDHGLDDHDILLDGGRLTFIGEEGDGESTGGDFNTEDSDEHPRLRIRMTGPNNRVQRSNSIGRQFGGKRPRSLYVIQDSSGSRSSARYRSTPAKATLPTGKKMMVYVRVSSNNQNNNSASSSSSHAPRLSISSTTSSIAESPLLRPSPPQSITGIAMDPLKAKESEGAKNGLITPGDDLQGSSNSPSSQSAGLKKEILPISLSSTPQLPRQPSSSSLNPSSSSSSTKKVFSTSSQASTSSTSNPPRKPTQPVNMAGVINGTSILSRSYSSFSASVGKNGKARMLGGYTLEQRRQRIIRFLDKRKKRVWMKRVKYGCRKELADSRPRVKGRFVPRVAQQDGEGEKSSIDLTTSTKLENMMPDYSVTSSSSGISCQDDCNLKSSRPFTDSTGKVLLRQTVTDSTITSSLALAKSQSTPLPTKTKPPIATASSMSSTPRATGLMRSSSVHHDSTTSLRSSEPASNQSSKSTTLSSFRSTTGSSGGGDKTSVVLGTGSLPQASSSAVLSIANRVISEAAASTALSSSSSSSSSIPPVPTATIHGSSSVCLGDRPTETALDEPTSIKVASSNQVHHIRRVEQSAPMRVASPAPSVSSVGSRVSHTSSQSSVRPPGTYKVIRKVISSDPSKLMSGSPGSHVGTRTIKRTIVSSNGKTVTTTTTGSSAIEGSGVLRTPIVQKKTVSVTSADTSTPGTVRTVVKTPASVTRTSTPGASGGAGGVRIVKRTVPASSTNSGTAVFSTPSSGHGTVVRTVTSTTPRTGVVRGKSSTIIRKACTANCKTCQQRTVSGGKPGTRTITRTITGKPGARTVVKSGTPGVVRTIVKQGGGSVIRTVIRSTANAVGRSGTPGTVTRTILKTVPGQPGSLVRVTKPVATPSSTASPAPATPLGKSASVGSDGGESLLSAGDDHHHLTEEIHEHLDDIVETKGSPLLTKSPAGHASSTVRAVSGKSTIIRRIISSTSGNATNVVKSNGKPVLVKKPVFKSSPTTLPKKIVPGSLLATKKVVSLTKSSGESTSPNVAPMVSSSHSTASSSSSSSSTPPGTCSPTLHSPVLKPSTSNEDVSTSTSADQASTPLVTGQGDLDVTENSEISALNQETAPVTEASSLEDSAVQGSAEQAEPDAAEPASTAN